MESKMYKAGDRVRVIGYPVSENGENEMVIGKAGTVVEDDGLFIEVALDNTPNPIDDTEGWLFFENEVEPCTK